jgi:hypothetical protein
MATSQDSYDPSTGLDATMSNFFREVDDRRRGVGRGGGSYNIEWDAAAHDAAVGNTMRDLYQKQWNDRIKDLTQRAMA